MILNKIKVEKPMTPPYPPLAGEGDFYKTGVDEKPLSFRRGVGVRCV